LKTVRVTCHLGNQRRLQLQRKIESIKRNLDNSFTSAVFGKAPD